MQGIIVKIEKLVQELQSTPIQSYQFHYILSELSMLHEQLGALV